jgi:hypothetical protein
MTTLASDIVAKASIILHDTVNERWTTSELLDWLNMGLTQIVLLKPDANIVAAEYQMAKGVKQKLPDGTSSYQDSQSVTLPAGVQLLDIPMNMGTDGITPGRAIKLVDKEVLDALDPLWPQASDSSVAQYVMYDQRTPDLFYVYPPQPSTSQGYLAVIYSSIPTPCADLDSSISINDEYNGALVNYVLYRAYSKESDTVDGSERAVHYYNTFLDGINRHDLIMRSEDPNRDGPSKSIES